MFKPSNHIFVDNVFKSSIFNNSVAMSLNKASGRKAEAVESVASEADIRKRLVSLYRDSGSNTDLRTSSLEHSVAGVRYREGMVKHLLKLGDTESATKIRNETIQILLEKSTAPENEVIEIMKHMLASEADVKKERTLMEAEFTARRQAAKAINDEYAKASMKLNEVDKNSKEAEEIQANINRLKSDYQQNAVEANKINNSLQLLSQQEQSGSERLNSVGTEAISYKLGAANLMMAQNDFDSAFNLATGTIKRFHGAGIYGLVENILEEVITASANAAATMMSEGKQDEAVRILELGIKSTMEVAASIDSAIKSASADPTLADLSIAMKVAAANLTAEAGEIEKARSMLNSWATEYEKAGMIDKAINLLELDLYLSGAERSNPFAKAARRM